MSYGQYFWIAIETDNLGIWLNLHDHDCQRAGSRTQIEHALAWSKAGLVD